jgi:hypothetical protein
MRYTRQHNKNPKPMRSLGKPQQSSTSAIAYRSLPSPSRISTSFTISGASLYRVRIEDENSGF